MAQPQVLGDQHVRRGLVDLQHVPAVHVHHQAVQRLGLQGVVDPRPPGQGDGGRAGVAQEAGVPEAGGPPLASPELVQAVERGRAEERHGIARAEKERDDVVPLQLRREGRYLRIDAAEEVDLPASARAQGEALEDLLQRQVLGGVLGNHARHVRDAGLDRPQGVVGGGDPAVPVILDLQTPLGFPLDAGEQHVLEEAGAHPAQRLMIAVL